MSSYSVTVTATDPSGSTNTVVVTINVVDVNEAPTIELAEAGLTAPLTLKRLGEEFVVTTPEQLALDLTSDPGGDNIFAAQLPVFDANDPEEATGLLIM